MGVKDLWTILAPVKREKSLEDLAGKTLAVDLSGWVCQADSTKVYVSHFIFSTRSLQLAINTCHQGIAPVTIDVMPNCFSDLVGQIFSNPGKDVVGYFTASL